METCNAGRGAIKDYDEALQLAPEALKVPHEEVKMVKDELIKMIENAGFEAVGRDTVYNRVAAV